METVIGGEYRIIKPLSEGGMGAVYIAEQASTGKRRALKLMKQELARDPRFRERFVLEAKVGARINSEHIVEVVGAGIDPSTGAPWLAMELLDGEDLASIITQRRFLPLAEVKEILGQLGHALMKAHEAGIVHRDLKPENLFIARPRRDGVPFTLKILDFGIAKLVSDAATAAATGALGTPLWMAPEQAETRVGIGPGADIWPLGLIAYYALTGRLYWRTAADEGASVTALLKEVLFEPIEPASVRSAAQGQPGRLPAGFDAWFARCVVRDPGARFTSVREAVDAFGALTSGSLGPAAFAATAPGAPSPPIARTIAMAPTLAVQVPTSKKRIARSRTWMWLLPLGLVAIFVFVAVLAATWGRRKLHPRHEDLETGPTKEDLADAKSADEILKRTPEFEAAPEALLPVEKDNPAFGDKHPLAVVVVFCQWSDPSCEKMARISDDLLKEKSFHFRIVYKHLAARDNDSDLLAANAAQGVFQSAGSTAFLKFRDAVFAHRGEITRANVARWAQDAGVTDPAEFGRRLDSGKWSLAVDRDGDLGARLRLRESALFSNCREGQDMPALPASMARSALLEEKRATKGGASSSFFHGSRFYEMQCKTNDEARAIYPVAPWRVRSPFASDHSEDAAHDIVLRFVAARARSDDDVLGRIAAETLQFEGTEISRAALIAQVSKKHFPAAVVGIRLEPNPPDAAVRRLEIDLLSREPKGEAGLYQQWLRVTRRDNRWEVSEVEPARISQPPTTCKQHMLSGMFESPVVSSLLLEPPSKAELEDKCIAHTAYTQICEPSLHICGVEVACYGGSSLAGEKLFRLVPETGVLTGPVKGAEAPVAFPRAQEIREACRPRDQ